MLHFLRLSEKHLRTPANFRGALRARIMEYNVPNAADTVEEIRAERRKLRAVGLSRDAHTPGEYERDKNADGNIPRRRSERQIPARYAADEHRHSHAQQHRNADRRDGVCIEHLQRFNVRGDHRNNGALLPGFQLGRAETAQRREDLVAQHRQQTEGNVVVAVLLGKPEQAAQHAATDGQRDERAVGKGDFLAERLGDGRSARERHAHGAQKARRAVNYGEQHNVHERTEQNDELRHDLRTAAARFRCRIHSSSSRYPSSSAFCAA